MSREAILKVKETEAEAEQRILDACATAKDMLERANREGQELCLATKTEMLQKREDMMALIQEKTEEIAAASLAEANEECKLLVRDVTLRRKIAEKIIIRGLDSKCR